MWGVEGGGGTGVRTSLTSRGLTPFAVLKNFSKSCFAACSLRPMVMVAKPEMT